MNKKKKQPKVLNTPDPHKIPKFIERTSNDADSISWSFSMIDKDARNSQKYKDLLKLADKIIE